MDSRKTDRLNKFSRANEPKSFALKTQGLLNLLDIYSRDHDQ